MPTTSRGSGTEWSSSMSSLMPPPSPGSALIPNSAPSLDLNTGLYGADDRPLNPVPANSVQKAFGMIGEDWKRAHDRWISDLVTEEQFLRGILTPIYSKYVTFWKMFLGQKTDRRDPIHEKWRALVHVPYPYSGVETIVAAMTDIMQSTDPYVQCEGVGIEDEEFARQLEKLFDYTFRKNKWALTMDLMFREMCIQGTTMPKLVWTERYSTIRARATIKDIKFFMESVVEAVRNGAAPPPKDPTAFEIWRSDVNLTQNYGVMVPAVPQTDTGYRKIRDYCGPLINRTPLWDLRFDPMEENIQAQRRIIHRVVKTRDWAEAQVKSGVWDEKQYLAAMNGWNGEQFETWQTDIAQMMGIEGVRNYSSRPRYNNMVEIWEVWSPFDTIKFAQVLNRQAVVNHSPDEHPYDHGQHVFHPIRNVPIPYQLLGLSELAPSERLYMEMDSLRELRIDALTLAVMPVFIKARVGGLSEQQMFLKPGLVIPGDPNTIKPILNDQRLPPEAYREHDEIKRDIDETNATTSNIRGGASTVGRVSATESERRFNQALVRTKQRVLRIEEEMSEIPRQMCMLWYQFGDPEQIGRIVGDSRMSKLQTLDRDKFLQTLDADIRFRAATKAINKDMAVQQIKDFVSTLAPLQALTLPEIRAAAKRWLELQGQKAVDVLVTTEGTDELVAKQKAMEAAAAAAAAGPQGGANGAPGAGAPGAVPPPSVVDQATADQILQAGTGQEPGGASPAGAPAPGAAPGIGAQ